MKKIFIGIALMVLLFGCIDLGGPQQNVTPPVTPNVTPPSNITPSVNDSTIIVTPQENQTVEQNYTPPPPPPSVDAKEINYTNQPNASFAIYLIYVGDQTNKLHGDAILIKKGDLDVLVDAGPSKSGSEVISFLNKRSVDDIDVLISTNADPWHYEGISAVSSKYKIEEFWWSGKTFNDQKYSTLVSGLGSNVKKVRVVERGFSKTLNGMNISVLNPKEKAFNDVNNDAIVLRIEDRNFSMVLLSGVQFGAQGEMVNNIKTQLTSNVMQAPYYGLGAGTSGIGNFLTTAKPEVIVVSGGPDESAASGGSRDPFRRLMDQHSIKYYENYKGGTVRVNSDGTNYSVSYFGS